MNKLRLRLRKPGYTESLIKESTRNTAWGPISSELNELSQLTYDKSELNIITTKLSKRLKSKHPIQISKSLTIIYFILQTGSDDFIKWLNANKFSIKTLIEYQADTKHNNRQLIQQSQNIRKKASEITKLVESEERLDAKRAEFRNLRLSMQSPTSRSSIDSGINMRPELDSRPIRQTKSLDINRSELFNGLNHFSSSSEGEMDTYPENSKNIGDVPMNLKNKKNQLSNILEIGEDVPLPRAINLRDINRSNDNSGNYKIGSSMPVNRSNSLIIDRSNSSSFSSRRALSENNPFRVDKSISNNVN